MSAVSASAVRASALVSHILPATLTLSVIIPTRNRPQRLAACLTALAAQSFPRTRFEVIVVDDGSETSMEPVVDRFRDSMQLRLIRRANAGPASARNTGAAVAASPLLVFTDDDCEPEVEWLSALHAQSMEHPECLIGGQTINGLPDNVYAAASQLLIDYLYQYQASVSAHGERAAPAFFTANNFGVPAALFRRVGGFDESFPLAGGEDRELCDRWQHLGLRLASAQSARVRHSHALSLIRFWRQHLNYGRGAWHLRRARRAHGRPPLRIEPLSFYWRLMTYPLRVSPTPRAAPLVGLMWLSQVANTAGFMFEKYRR